MINYKFYSITDWNETATSKPKSTPMSRTKSEIMNRTSTSILKQQLGLLPPPPNNNSGVGSSISQLHLSSPQTGNLDTDIKATWVALAIQELFIEL